MGDREYVEAKPLGISLKSNRNRSDIKSRKVPNLETPPGYVNDKR